MKYRSESQLLKSWRIPAVFCAFVLGGATAHAQITSSLVNEETDIINMGGTVVSAVHFQNGTTGSGASDPNPLVVNGISHTVGRASAANLTFTGSGIFEGDFRNGETGFVQDGSNILQVLYSGIAGAGSITMSVSGLTVGKEYLFQAYWETNNIAGAVLEATIEGDTQGGLVALADKFTNPGGTMISYQFVAGDNTLNAFFNRTDSVTNDWLSGYSLQEVPDVVDPELVTTHPVNNAVYVDPSDDLVATFDSAVQPGTGNISLFTAADVLVEQFDVNDVTAPGTVIFSGSAVTISPSAPLVGGTGYYVLIDSTAVEDLSNNSFAGISDKEEWSFTASIITTRLVNEETDIVNTGGTLVSAVHFQGAGTTDPDPLVLNGIPHTLGTASDANLTINTTFEGDFRNGETGFPLDGSNIIQVLYSGIAGAGVINMSVSGLTAGEEYLFQAYWEANNLNPGAVLEATIEGETQGGLVPLADKVTNPGGNVISYQFVAGDDTLNASFNRTDTATNDWLSGYSLQRVSAAATPYADWASGQVPPLSGGFNDDDDLDGTPNGHEFYYFDSDPNTAEGLGSPVTGATKTGANTFEFTHNRRIERDDVTETYRWSSDLVIWYAADGLESDGTNTITVADGTVVGGPTTNLETVTAVATVGGPAMTKLFVRQELSSP